MKKLLNLTTITILSTIEIANLTSTNFKENNNKVKNNCFQEYSFTKMTTNINIIKSDAQLFNDVKTHLQSFTVEKPLDLVGFDENNIFADVLKQINDNLQATFGIDFWRIKNLTMPNLDRTIKDDGLYGIINWKYITFSVGSNKTSFNDIKVAFKIKSDAQLFADVKSHLKSFTVEKPFEIKGISENDTIANILSKVNDNLQATFKADATRIKNLTMPNLDKTISADGLFNEGINWKYVAFNVGINKTSFGDIRIYFNIKSDWQLFTDVKTHLASFKINKPFYLQGISENDTIANILSKINDNLQTTFKADATRIKNLTIPNLDKIIKEDGLLKSVINWKYVAFNVGINKTSFGDIKIYFNIKSDWQLFNDVKTHLASFDDKKPFYLQGISENDTIANILSKINDNLQATFKADATRIKNLKMDYLDSTIIVNIPLYYVANWWSYITFNVGSNKTTINDIKIAFNMKSDLQLFNEVKRYLASFNVNKPFNLTIGKNDTIANILSKVNDNLKTTFGVDFSRIKNLTISNLDKIISTNKVFKLNNNWKKITFKIGMYKTLLGDIKIAFNMKSDLQLFDGVKSHLQSFNLEEISENKTITE